MKTRFSLRILLVAVTLIAIGCGIVAYTYRSHAAVNKVLAVANNNGYVVLLSDNRRYCALVSMANASLSDELVTAIERARVIEAVHVHVDAKDGRMSVAFHRRKDARGYPWWVRNTVQTDILDGEEFKVKIVPNQFRQSVPR